MTWEVIDSGRLILERGDHDNLEHRGTGPPPQPTVKGRPATGARRRRHRHRLNGLVYLVGAEALDGLFGLDAGLLGGSGGFLLAFGLTVGALTRRPRPPHTAVWIVVGTNVVWAMTGLLVAVIGWGSPSAVGTAWIIGQALLVGGFAAWQATAVTHQRVQS